jgi:hypothetical protein
MSSVPANVPPHKDEEGTLLVYLTPKRVLPRLCKALPLLVRL